MTNTLFPTAEALGAPPPKKGDDLGRILIVERDSPQGQAILAARAERTARLEAAGLDMTQVALLYDIKKEVA